MLMKNIEQLQSTTRSTSRRNKYTYVLDLEFESDDNLSIFLPLFASLIINLGVPGTSGINLGFLLSIWIRMALHEPRSMRVVCSK